MALPRKKEGQEFNQFLMKKVSMSSCRVEERKHDRNSINAYSMMNQCLIAEPKKERKTRIQSMLTR